MTRPIGMAGRLRIALTLALLAGLGAASGAHARTYTVNRMDDPTVYNCLPPAQTCTLRSALATAAGNPDPPDVINLPAGNYRNFQEAAFHLTGNISVVGAGSDTTTVYGSDESGVFELDGLGPQTISVSGVTIRDGHAGSAPGGGISKTLVGPALDLTLSDVAVVDNFAASGGGISFSGSGSTLTVRDSLIAHNTTVFDGAGIETGVFTRLQNVTVTGNTSGIAARGGGLFTGPMGTTYLTSSTVAHNTVGAGGQGGNLFGINTAKNTIIADGIGPAGKENCGGATTVSYGGNVEDANQCFPQPMPGDQLGTDPLLGTLAATPIASSTLALAPSSPAINAAADCTDAPGNPVTRDQRAVARPQGTACDAGAFEFAAPSIGGAPAITGAGEPGQTLTCSVPSVASPDGPVTTALTWLRDGAAVGTGATFAGSAADAGHALTCRITATNAAGAVSATSAGVAVPSPPAPPAAPPPAPPPPPPPIAVTPPPPPPSIARVATGPLTLSARSRRGRVTVSGRLTLRRGSRCQGRIAIAVRRGSTRVASKQTTLRTRSGACRYSTTIRPRNVRRRARLRVSARFTGTTSLLPRSAPTRTIRL